MTPDLLALARRAAACKGWRWMNGMFMVLDPSLPWNERRVVRYSEAVREALGDDRFSPRAWTEGTAPVPDLGDPATLGCLLALVRKACGDTAIYASTENDGTWGVFNTGDGIVTHKHDSEAEALVAALEAAP